MLWIRNKKTWPKYLPLIQTTPRNCKSSLGRNPCFIGIKGKQLKSLKISKNIGTRQIMRR